MMAEGETEKLAQAVESLNKTLNEVKSELDSIRISHLDEMVNINRDRYEALGKQWEYYLKHQESAKTAQESAKTAQEFVKDAQIDKKKAMDEKEYVLRFLDTLKNVGIVSILLSAIATPLALIIGFNSVGAWTKDIKEDTQKNIEKMVDKNVLTDTAIQTAETRFKKDFTDSLRSNVATSIIVLMQQALHRIDENKEVQNVDLMQLTVGKHDIEALSTFFTRQIASGNLSNKQLEARLYLVNALVARVSLRADDFETLCELALERDPDLLEARFYRGKYYWRYFSPSTFTFQDASFQKACLEDFRLVYDAIKDIDSKNSPNTYPDLFSARDMYTVTKPQYWVQRCRQNS